MHISLHILARPGRLFIESPNLAEPIDVPNLVAVDTRKDRLLSVGLTEEETRRSPAWAKVEDHARFVDPFSAEGFSLGLPWQVLEFIMDTVPNLVTGRRVRPIWRDSFEIQLNLEGYEPLQPRWLERLQYSALLGAGTPHLVINEAEVDLPHRRYLLLHFALSAMNMLGVLVTLGSLFVVFRLFTPPDLLLSGGVLLLVIAGLLAVLALAGFLGIFTGTALWMALTRSALPRPVQRTMISRVGLPRGLLQVMRRAIWEEEL